MKNNTPLCRFLLLFCQGATGLVVGLQPALMPEALEELQAIGWELRDAAICHIAPWASMPCLQTAGGLIAKNFYRSFEGRPGDDFDLELLDREGWQAALEVSVQENRPPPDLVAQIAETLVEKTTTLELGTGMLVVLPPRLVTEVVQAIVKDPDLDLDLALGEGIMLVYRDNKLWIGEIYPYQPAA